VVANALVIRKSCTKLRLIFHFFNMHKLHFAFLILKVTAFYQKLNQFFSTENLRKKVF